MKYAIQRNGKSELVNSDTLVWEEDEQLEKIYVVRLILDTGLKFKVIAEEEFKNKPTSTQIIWCLKKHEEASFADVTERYKIRRSDSELPFE